MATQNSPSSPSSTSKPLPPSNRLYDIPSLENDAANFQTWKFRIKMVLDIRGLLSIVDGTLKCPTESQSEEYTNWQKLDKEARAQICLTLKDEPLNGVLHVATSKEAWDKLCERYEGKGKQTQAYLIGELFRNTLSDESPLEPQLNMMRHKAHVLSSLGLKLEDALVAIAIVLSLPESYSTLRTILMSTEDKLLPDSVISQILIEEKSRKNPAQTALLAHGGKGKGKDQKGDKSKKKCSYCKKKGHVKEECRRLKSAENKDQKPSASNSSEKEKKDGELTAKVAVMMGEPSSNSESLCLFVANALTERSGLLTKWIIDSGASSPMSSHRDWFHMYRDISPPKKVWLGDNRYILATGIGQLHLEMDLGGGKKGHTIIRSAYYVPDVSGNLLSVSYLIKQGYSVNFSDNECHIFCKQDRKLCGIAKEVDGLFIVNAKPITPEHAYISRTTSEISEDSDLDPKSHEVALIAQTTTSKVTLGIWHRRLGHISYEAVKRLLRRKMVTGMDISSNDASGLTCVPCLEGKQTRDIIPKESSTKHPRILHRIYSDLCGPMQTQSRHGEFYFLTFIDGNTHYVKVKLLKSKNEACTALKTFIERAEVETGERVNYFRSDGGGEYGSKELATYFESKGIHHEKTNAYTPQENGVAERMNRTIVEMARTFLQDAGLPNTYWSFAVSHATYVINRTPTRTLKPSITPFEAYTGNKPSIAHLRIFGCKGYVHVPHEKRQKLDKKTLECTHLGYSEHKRAFILAHRSSGRIVESRDVHFDEGELVEPSRVRIETEISQNEEKTEILPVKRKKDTESCSGSSMDLQEPLDGDSDDDDDGNNSDTSSEGYGTTGSSGSNARSSTAPDSNKDRSDRSATNFRATPTSPTDSATQKTPETTVTHLRNTKNLPVNPYLPPPIQPDEPRRSTRNRRVPVPDDDIRYSTTSYGNRSARHLTGETSVAGGEVRDENSEGRMKQVTDVTHESVNAAVLGDPLTFHDAMSREDCEQWKNACNEELETLKKFGVFEEVPRPRDRKIVGSKWVFRMKMGPDGQIERYKARLVAQGFSQVEGIDYNETFAPVTKFNSIRLLLALAARYDWEIHQMDVKSAFLNGELEEEIYMQPPPGYKATPDTVWRLKKALYGLKQAGREWYKKFSSELGALGFTRLQADHCVFYKNTNGHHIIIAVYVDDNLIICDSPELVAQTKEALNSLFDMTDLGELHWILNMEVTRDRPKRTITLSQAQYIEDILERHGMADCKPAATPMEVNLKLEKLDTAEVNTTEYQQLIGSLMYGSIGTRFDITHDVGVLSRHNHTPGKRHHTAVKRVFRYLRGASDNYILYDGRSSIEGPVIYCDADWAGDPSDRKSISGYTAILSGAAISWSSKKQATVSLSSTEAEYIAAARAAQEATWIHTFLSEIGHPLKKPITLYVDNQSAIKLIQNPVAHDRTKHIDIKYHFIRDAQAREIIKVEYCPTNDQVADVLTKPLSHEKHKRFTEQMGLRNA
jgi:Reverse transcriptase (RNA-dependent DNA polymerase)/gag-polypeptide of LTR copia-type/GAG-pre-integrase domain